MAAISGVTSLSSPSFVLSSSSYSSDFSRAKQVVFFRSPCTSAARGRLSCVVVRAAPDKLSDKVAESIKEAEEACAGDPASGECVAAWDEVEELSAAASHARDKKKGEDVLEEYCKDNPETDECRTYDN